MAAKQTAGRDALNAFVPEFARLNDDGLLGEALTQEMDTEDTAYQAGRQI